MKIKWLLKREGNVLCWAKPVFNEGTNIGRLMLLFSYYKRSPLESESMAHLSIFTYIYHQIPYYYQNKTVVGLRQDGKRQQYIKHLCEGSFTL